ncbi:MAG: ATP-binding protein [Devosia sp.]|nr:ATP-binding protein [Devosia sp.]
MDDMFRTAVEACSAGMILVGPDGLVQLANAEAERMFGYHHGELVGTSIEVLVPDNLRRVHEQSRVAFGLAPSKRSMGVGRDLRAVRRNKSEFPVEIGLTPIHNDDGVCVMAFVVDITARREAEKAVTRYMGELERANEGLARFAYVASHDIQEPLRKIVAFADILRDGLASGNTDDVGYASKVMQESAVRARQLVTDLLAFAQSLNSQYNLGPVHVLAKIEIVLADLSQLLQEEHADVLVQCEDFSVLADRTQFIQLVQNIVSNAIKYHKLGVKPEIRISSERRPDGGICLSIEDSGIGFEPQYTDEIFEPFKRLHTRDEYQGSGIGLAICKTIVERHGWQLSAHSEPMVGSRFDVVFGPDSILLSDRLPDAVAK